MNYIIITYLEDIDVNDDGSISISENSMKSEFEDLDYPTLKVSHLAINFHKNILPTLTYDFTSLDDYSIIYKMIDSDLRISHPTISKIMQMNILELVSINYCLANDTSEIENITPSDIDRIISNLEIMCDWFGDYNKYCQYIPRLREFEISLGYIRNQLYFISTAENYR